MTAAEVTAAEERGATREKSSKVQGDGKARGRACAKTKMRVLPVRATKLNLGEQAHLDTAHSSIAIGILVRSSLL